MSRLVKDDIVVSIIIPTYHRPVMLRESIQTALKQHYPRQRYEVIVVSDGDPGARSVASEFDEVIYLELPSNRGQSAALNFAFPHARGRYIMIQHDDDRAHPNKLAELATYLDHWPEVGIAFTQANCIDADGNLLEEVTAKKMKRHRRLLGIGFSLETELERNSISGASTMYRRAMVAQVGGWDESLHNGEELHIYLGCLRHRWRVGFLDVVTSDYRLYAGNKSRDPTEDTTTFRARTHLVARTMGIEQRRRIIRENVHIVIASLGSRAHGLRLSVWNALPFAEHIYLSLHGYDSVPDWAKDPKIKVRLSQKCGNNGTADKFWWSKQIRQSGGGYVIHMDDDVIYPKDYVMKMKFAIERYERRAVVCAHGALLTRLPVDNYYKDRRCFHFNYALAEDTFVHVPGIVATAYHTDTITLNLQDFIGEHTQDDIYFAVKAQQKKIPIVCIQREAGWLRPNRGISSVGSICDRYRHGCPAVSDTINSLKYWQVHTCEPTQRRVVI